MHVSAATFRAMHAGEFNAINRAHHSLVRLMLAQDTASTLACQTIREAAYWRVTKLCLKGDFVE
jgi:hypothetical protein